MKKRYLWLCMVITACSASQKIPNNEADLNAYSKPFKIFGVGYWNKSTMVLTLTDIHNQYFTIKIPLDTNLKVGLVYNQ